MIDGIYKFLGLRLPKTALEFPKPESKTFKKKIFLKILLKNIYLQILALEFGFQKQLLTSNFL